MWRSKLILSLAVVLAHQSSPVWAGEDCLGGYYKVLKNSSFSGPLLCKSHDVSLRKIGSLRSNVGSLYFFDYRYRFHPEGGAVAHGGQRLLVFDKSHTYVGQYALSPPPYFDISIIDKEVIFSRKGGQDERVDFSSMPKNIHLDGENLKIFR